MTPNKNGGFIKVGGAYSNWLITMAGFFVRVARAYDIIFWPIVIGQNVPVGGSKFSLIWYAHILKLRQYIASPRGW